MNERVARLLDDPGTLRCWREVVTGDDPITLDGIAACFGDVGDRGSSSDGVAAAADRPYAHGVIVDRALVERINATYREVSRAGFLTRADLDERLLAWLRMEGR